FALRGLAVLGALDGPILARAAGFLRSSLQRGAAPVDFFSLLYSCLIVQAAGGEDVLSASPPGWDERVAATLASFRTKDGGYAKMPGGPSGSTYTTFLIALCHEVLGRSLPDPEAARAFILSRRREDGGFVEIAQM
ncbi:MAG: geranyl transferase, partial [Gemmataceae bacterium]|nr:geranyl transferase [Gemmataceae bacterium]